MTDFIKIIDKPKLYQAKKDKHVEVLVGGINTDHFAPSANFSYKLESDLEQFFFNICDDETQMDTVGKDEEWNSYDKIKIKDKDESTFKSNENGLKIERVFYERPTKLPKYKLVHSKGVQFVKQTKEALLEAEPNGNVPDSVDGSYSIYCDKKGRYLDKSGNVIVDYGFGKLGYIAAPYWLDSVGSEFKGSQEIIGDILSFTLPSDEWLDSAVYPIRLDPTIGYDTIGGSTAVFTSTVNVIITSGKDTAIENGTVTSIDVYYADSLSTSDIKVGIYTDNSGPDALNATESQHDNIGSQSAQWKQFSHSNSIVNSSTYWFAMSWRTTSNSVTAYYDIGPNPSRYYDNHTWTDAWPLTFTQDSSSAAVYSIRATYTADSSGVNIEGSLPAMNSIITRKRSFHREIGGSI